MFALNDKVVLSLVNIKNFNNVYLDYSYNLPVDIPIDILENFASIDVFEYHEGRVNSGFIAFSIYVGEKSTLNELLENNKKILLKDNLKIENINKPVLYRIIDNNIYIINELRANDIVVSNKEELKKTINILSLEYTNLNKAITRIRTL